MISSETAKNRKRKKHRASEIANMSSSHIYLAAFVFCKFLLMAQTGTWLSFNQNAHNPSDFIPYVITDKDLTSVMKMCKEEIDIPRITRSERNFAEMCAALSDLISGR
ncbi:hypothetical protein ACH3XW_26055 [Acanthocheilonema viteae]